MKFRLIYNGRLKGSRSKDVGHVHCIRTAFQSQIKLLWDHEPLRDLKQFWLADPPRQGFATHVNVVSNHKFASIIHSRSRLLAHLDILFLRPQPPGNIVDNSGDIDNRIKTLLDALRIPKENELPKGFSANDDQGPFHCLLEDDKLVSRFSVETDRLLIEQNHQQNVVLVISVSLAASKGTHALV